MALRAFHANPCIGGFGGENSGDVFVPSDDPTNETHTIGNKNVNAILGFVKKNVASKVKRTT